MWDHATYPSTFLTYLYMIYHTLRHLGAIRGENLDERCRREGHRWTDSKGKECTKTHSWYQWVPYVFFLQVRSDQTLRTQEILNPLKIPNYCDPEKSPLTHMRVGRMSLTI